MPDVPVSPKPEPEPTLAEKTAPVLAAIRTLLTGDADGAVRRPLLFLAAGLGVMIQFLVPVLGAGIAIVAILLLAWTDHTA